MVHDEISNPGKDGITLPWEQPAAPAPTPAPTPTPAPAPYKPATAVPDEFKGNSYDQLISHLEGKVAEYQPLTPEQLAKMRRRQKAEGIVSGISDAVRAIANLAATHNYAPNGYDPTGGMSERAKARFEREKAERQADDDRYYNYAVNLGKLKDADRANKFGIWQYEQQMAQQAQAREDAQKAAAAQQAWKEREWQRQEQWHGEEKDRWEKQFSATQENERRKLSVSWAQVQKGKESGVFTYSLGSGHGYATIPNDRLNAQTVASIYGLLPADEQAKAKGKPHYKEVVEMGQKRKVIDYYEQPSQDAMLTVIGAYLADGSADATTQGNVRNAIKELAGKPVQQADNQDDNTPPSRRQ